MYSSHSFYLLRIRLPLAIKFQLLKAKGVLDGLISRSQGLSAGIIRRDLRFQIQLLLDPAFNRQMHTVQRHGCILRGKGGERWVAGVKRLDRIWWNCFRESSFTGELIFSRA